MKRLIAGLLGSLLVLNTYAVMDPQRQMEIRQVFQSGHMEEGVRLTEKEIKKDKKEAAWYWMLDDIYSMMGEDSMRIVILNRALAVKKLSAPDETRQRKAQALFDLGHYQEADALLATFRPTRAIVNARAKCLLADSLRRHPLQVEIRNMGDSINTEWDNIWPGISADGNTFSTTVIVGKKGWIGNIHDIQEDIYISHRKDSVWGAAQPLPAPINSHDNEGASALSADGRYVFYVACNRKDSHGSCDIYYIMRQGDGWSEPIHPGAPLNTRYWESTPYLAASGKELFFASNREGGTGGKDLWRCAVAMDRNGMLIFGKSENLGNHINTVFDEVSPFLHSDGNTLYFSSNGWPGMGNSDVFMSKRDSSGQWSKPHNLGYPINTHRDEIGFVLAASGDKAYLSASGSTSDDRRQILEISLPAEARPQPMTATGGYVVDATTQEPILARVEVFDTETGKMLFTTFSDKLNGHFTAVFPEGRIAGFNITRPGYLPHSRRHNPTQAETENIIALEPIVAGSRFRLENIYFATNSSELQEASSLQELGKLVQFLKENPDTRVEIAGHTDNQGSDSYNQSLSLARAQRVADYLTSHGIHTSRLSYQGYGSTRPLATNDTDEGRARNRRIEVEIK